MSAIAALAVHLALIWHSGNFAPVVTGQVYRAAQVTPEQIAKFGTEPGIRSILNLRGAAPGRDWYEAERAASAQSGIVHADFRMTASREMGAAEALRLVALMRLLPKPMLIHCRQGADRTGLAAALYLARIAGSDEETAEAQISFRFGHVGLPYLSAAWPMDTSWEQLEPLLGFGDS